MNAYLDPIDNPPAQTAAADYQLNVNDSVQSLVSHYPAAAPLLTALGVDLAGLGWLPLRTVVATLGLDLASVCAAICTVLTPPDRAMPTVQPKGADDLRYSDARRVAQQQQPAHR